MGNLSYQNVPSMKPSTQIARCRQTYINVWDFVEDNRGIVCYNWGSTFAHTTPVLMYAPNIVQGSPLAAIKGGSTHPARVYYQERSLAIREIVEDDRNFTLTDTKLPQMMLGSGLAAVCWSGLDHIRLYFQDMQGRLCEQCFDKGSGWFPGKVLIDKRLPPIPVAACRSETTDSALRAVVDQISVFYIHEGEIRALVYDPRNGWSPESILLTTSAADNSKIAVAGNGLEDAYVFFQHRYGRLHYMKREKKGWLEADLADQGDVPSGVPLAATTHQKADTGPRQYHDVCWPADGQIVTYLM